MLSVWVKPEPEMLFPTGSKMKILDVVHSDRHDVVVGLAERHECHRKFQLDQNHVFFPFGTLLSRDASIYSLY